MTEIFQTSLTTVIAVYVVIAAGMACRYAKRLDQKTTTATLWIVINILMPCLYVSKLIGNSVFDNPANLYLPPFVGFGLVLVCLLLAFVYVRAVPTVRSILNSPRKIGSFVVGVGLVNYGYVPIPLLNELYPGDDRILAVLFVVNIGIELALWSVCIFALEGNFSLKTFRKILNIPMITIVVSLFLNVVGLDRFVPHAVLKPFDLLGAAAIPLSLFIVGATIAEFVDGKVLAKSWKSFLKIGFHSCLLRLILFPLLTVGLVYFCPFSDELKIVLIVHASMASAVFPIVMARLFNGDVQTALFTTLSNSIVALATTPVWITLGLELALS